MLQNAILRAFRIMRRGRYQSMAAPISSEFSLLEPTQGEA